MSLHPKQASFTWFWQFTVPPMASQNVPKPILFHATPRKFQYDRVHTQSVKSDRFHSPHWCIPRALMFSFIKRGPFHFPHTNFRILHKCPSTKKFQILHKCPSTSAPFCRSFHLRRQKIRSYLAPEGISSLSHKVFLFLAPIPTLVVDLRCQKIRSYLVPEGIPPLSWLITFFMLQNSKFRIPKPIFR